MADFPFDVVAFDLDGTLADTAPDLTSALNHALAELGRPPVSAESVRGMIGHGARALLQKGLGATGGATEELVERGFPIFIDHYLAHIADGTQIFTGLDAALDALVGGDTLPTKKPDPAMLFEVVARCGGGRAAYVGDSITDTNTGRNAGLPTIAVTFGFSDRAPELLGATALIGHYDELIPTLERLGG